MSSPVSSPICAPKGKQRSITTLAGNGTTVFNGDRGPGPATGISKPCGIAVDRDGNLFFSEYDRHIVRRIDAVTGTVTVVAGNGKYGFTNDGGCSTMAKLYNPMGLATDGLGHLFIADASNYRVRRVDASGTITTYAGNGTTTAVNGAATQSGLYTPSDVAADTAGNVYIAEYNGHRVRKVSLDGNITTVAGTGSAGYDASQVYAVNSPLYHPTGIAVDADNNLYITEYYHRVRKVTPDGKITTLIGDGSYSGGFAGDGGPAARAKVNIPQGVAADKFGRLYIADSGNHRLRMVDMNLQEPKITTEAGNGTNTFEGDGTPANSATLNSPWGVVADIDGNVYICDQNNQRVRMVSAPVSSDNANISVIPGGAVTLTKGGSRAYPGVEIHNNGLGAVPPQDVIVSLPALKGLRFEAEGANGAYELTVYGAGGTQPPVRGTLQASGTQLYFPNVNLLLPSVGSYSAIWLPITATDQAPLGATALTFQVGGRTSASSQITVVD
ncbi:NHL repeat-containing protein [Streptomyces sp. NPDC092307]|uniref:NHL repeat-containing protein n=1 Tax=Streptomyces sp. NPDC092307 TaxID=3366013 RepID=UPI0037FC711A